MESGGRNIASATGFEWDETKRRFNLRKHEIDFVDVQAVFDGRPTATNLSPRNDEERFTTTAIFDDLFVTVVWTWRGTKIRLISARRARHEERREYRELHP